MAEALLVPPSGPRIDFLHPKGEPALTAPDSVSWRVFANPASLFIGGVTAVILELAEPKVRTGIWEHSSFRRDPVGRLRRTGHAAMATVYGPASAAAAMISQIAARHARISGKTPCGQAYCANDLDLLVWVKATASFGFLEAYGRYVRRLSAGERDAFHAEGAPASLLYGASGAPTSEAQLQDLFRRMAPRLEASPIVFEFLSIMRDAPLLPQPLRAGQRLLIRAATDLVPGSARARLGLGPQYGLRPGERLLVRALCACAAQVHLDCHPAVQARIRVCGPATKASWPEPSARLA